MVTLYLVEDEMTPNEAIRAVFEALMQRQEPGCCCWYIFDHNEGRSNVPRSMPRKNCGHCGGTGDDPRIEAALVLVGEPCKHLNAAWRDSAGIVAFCPTCGVERDYTHDTPEQGYALPDALVPRTVPDDPAGEVMANGLLRGVEDALEGETNTPTGWEHWMKHLQRLINREDNGAKR